MTLCHNDLQNQQNSWTLLRYDFSCFNLPHGKNFPGRSDRGSSLREATPWFLWGITLWSIQFPCVWALGESAGHESVLKQPFSGLFQLALPAKSSHWWSAVLLPGTRADHTPWGFVTLRSPCFLFPPTGDPAACRWDFWTKHRVKSTRKGGSRAQARAWDKSILEKTSLISSSCV